jgi:hypothetical protein
MSARCHCYLGNTGGPRGWFTEGFDIGDLKAAARLLSELA